MQSRGSTNLQDSDLYISELNTENVVYRLREFSPTCDCEAKNAILTAAFDVDGVTQNVPATNSHCKNECLLRCTAGECHPSISSVP